MSKKRKSIKSQISLSIFKTIFFSFIATILFTAITLFFVLNLDDRYYANYYENQVPEIISLIHTHGEDIIEGSNIALERLDNFIPYPGMRYSITDRNGNNLYGTINGELNYTTQEIMYKINSSTLYENEVTQYIPIIDDDDQLVGSVILTYKIESEIETFFYCIHNNLYCIPLYLYIVFHLLLWKSNG